MKLITNKNIEIAFQKFDNLSEDEVNSIMVEFTEEQPLLFAYIMTIDDELSQNDRQALITVAAQVWFVLKQSLELTTVSEELLDTIDAGNDKLLHELSEENEEEGGLEKLIAQHKQPELMQMLIACLNDENISEEPIADENIMYMFMYLLNFMDALLASAKN